MNVVLGKYYDTSLEQIFVCKINNRLAIKCYIATMEAFGLMQNERGTVKL